MRSILVPTDLSACAKTAAKAAVQLAQQFEAEVHLLHCIKPKTIVSDKSLASNELFQHSKDLNTEYPDISIQLHLTSGNLLPTIEEKTSELGIDFMVIGSHGASGKKEFFIGSNAQKIVRSIHLPILVIKNPFENLDFKKVIFASNFNADEKEPFRRFLDFIKPFEPKVYLVNIDTPSLFDAPFIVQRDAMEDFQEIASPLESEIILVKHFSVDGGVRLFSKEINADLVVINNYNRHPVKRIMVGSNVEALVNHVEIPVLTIDFQA